MTTMPSTEKVAVQPTGCCPPFDPAPWQDKEITWRDRPFVRDHVRALFHVPLNMGRKVMENMARIEAAHMTSDLPLMLSEDHSPWGTDIFIAVKGDVPGATMDHLSGTFLTEVFEGPFKDAGIWAREMAANVAQRGRTLEKLYFGYTTCPKCARAYGKNYVIVFAKVKEPARPASLA